MSRQPKLVRAMNGPIFGEPEVSLPNSSSPLERPRPNGPLEEICAEIISILEETPIEFRCLETLAEIKSAGPEYLKEFLIEFSM